MFVSSSPVARSRLGLVVPKHRQKIVRRNLLKRRLRELGRTLLLPRLDAAAGGDGGRTLDVLLRARPEAYDASFAELREQVSALAEELAS